MDNNLKGGSNDVGTGVFDDSPSPDSNTNPKRGSAMKKAALELVEETSKNSRELLKEYKRFQGNADYRGALDTYLKLTTAIADPDLPAGAKAVLTKQKEQLALEYDFN